MATTLQPFAPWMRDLSRFMNTPGAASAFLPPADVLVSEDGVTVLIMRLPEPAQTQPRRIQIRPNTATGNGAGMQAQAEGGPGDFRAATGGAVRSGRLTAGFEGRPLPCLPPTQRAGGPEDRV